MRSGVTRHSKLEAKFGLGKSERIYGRVSRFMGRKVN